MPLYVFTGRNVQGEEVKGQLQGATVDAVVAQLSRRGVTPIGVDEVQPKNDFLERLQERLNDKPVTIVDLIIFCRQMYTVNKAGVPLIQGVRGLANSLSHQRFQRVLHGVADQLEKGVELSAAMSQHPKVFNKLFVSLVNVGENSGQLDEAFNQLSQYLERDLDTAKRIKSATRYPSFVLAALVIAMVVINIFVIPNFADMFASFGAELPLPTRILLGTSAFFVNYWHYLLFFTVTATVLFRVHIKTEEGSRQWGRIVLKIPIVGDIIERASMGRYARSFGLMLRSGVPLIPALTLCSNVIDNPWLGDKILAIREGIERGEGLLTTHYASGMFTPLVLQMIGVGEESGQVDTLLQEVAEFYEREVDYDLKTLSDRIEPIMIVMMAGFVLILALGIFLPMWNMYSLQAG